MIRRCAVSALAVATASTLVACSSSGGDKASPSPSPTKSSSSATTPITQPTTTLKSVPNSPVTRKQAAITSCSSTASGWESKGTVKNIASSSKTFTITIYFTTNPGGTLQSYGSTKVKVAAGETGNWTVATKFAASKNTLCVLRGVA